MTPWLALLVSALVAFVGHRIRWLTGGAAPAAAVVGTCVLAGAGIRGMALLGLFFVSSSALTAWTDRRIPATGAQRTVRQVLANGWTAALGGLLIPVAPGLGWAVLAGGLAAAQADTWATEVGELARRPPVLITTWRPVPAGTSGGITMLGTVAGAAGAALLAALGWGLGLPRAVAGAAAAAGTAGMLADSLLGATVQAAYRCPRCHADTEAPVHGCDTPVALVRGRRWVTNDVVNLTATGIGAAVAAGFAAAGR